MGLNAEQLVGAAVAASAGRTVAGMSGVVALNLGGEAVALEIVDGRVVGPASPLEAPVMVPLTGPQLSALLDGSVSMAQAFMTGDLKPEGATGPLLALIELFEDGDFRHQLATSAAG